jgi:ADP-ribose pyrophosphatase
MSATAPVVSPIFFSPVSHFPIQMPSIVMNEKTLHSETVFNGLIFDLERHEVELDDGTLSQRDVVRHGGAVGVLARKSDGTHLFVRQYRKAIEQVTLEIVAGTLEAGEDPELCAHRELQEETGYTARTLEYLGTVHPSPGFLSEEIRIYFAEVEDEAGPQSLDEDERVEPVIMSTADFDSEIAAGRIKDSKTLSAWLFYRMKIDPWVGSSKVTG